MTLWCWSVIMLLFESLPFLGRLPTNTMWTLFRRVSAGWIVLEEITHVWMVTLIYHIRFLRLGKKILSLTHTVLNVFLFWRMNVRPIKPQRTRDNIILLNK